MVASTLAKLTDLPAELLHEICSEFDTKTLIRVSQTCRGLFHVTRFFIWKSQVTYLQTLANRGDLTTKPNIEMVDLMGQEDIWLDFIELCIPESPSWAMLYSCYGLFSRIDYIGHVELDLSLPPAWKISAPTLSQLAVVINDIVGRPETMLTVTGSEGASVDWPFAYGLTSKAADGTGFQLVQMGLKTSPRHFPRNPSPRLRALRVDGNQLLHLSLFSWTLDIINKAPITCLSVQKTDLRHSDWTYILKNITIPTLSDLSLGSSQIVFHDLYRFLMRHPSITVLNLMGGSSGGSLIPYSSEGLLPQLEELAADSVYLKYFLHSNKAHPMLTRIAMCSKFGEDHSQFVEILQSVTQRKQTTSLVLLFNSQPGLLSWLQNTNHPPAKNVIMLEVRVKDLGTLSETSQDAIYNWLGKFPSLRYLSIGATSMPSGTMDFLWNRYKQPKTAEHEEDAHRYIYERRQAFNVWWKGLRQEGGATRWGGSLVVTESNGDDNLSPK